MQLEIHRTNQALQIIYRKILLIPAHTAEQIRQKRLCQCVKGIISFFAFFLTLQFKIDQLSNEKSMG